MFRLHDAVTRAMFILGAIALLGIVGSYLVEVVMRYVFNAPTLWSGSAVAYLLAVSAMLGMPELARTSGHIAITMLEDRMTPARRHSHRRQVAALTAAICVAAAWMVWTETVRQGQSGTRERGGRVDVDVRCFRAGGAVREDGPEAAAGRADEMAHRGPR